MKNKLFLSLFAVLLSLVAIAQPRQLQAYLVGKATLSQQAAGANTLDIRLSGFTDETGMFDGTSIDNTCVLIYFNTNDSRGYFLPITTVVTPSSINPIVRIDITGFAGLNGSVDGQGVVYKRNSTRHVAPFVSGIAPSLQQVVDEGMKRDLETLLSSASVDTSRAIGSIASYWVADSLSRVEKDTISSQAGYWGLKKSLSNNESANVYYISDSRGENGYTDGYLRKRLIENYGDGGFLVNLFSSQLVFGEALPTILGATATTSGLATKHPTGNALEFTANGNFYELNTSTIGAFQSIEIYYPQQGVSTTYDVSIDGNVVGSFTTTTGNSVDLSTFSGFSNSSHTLRITKIGGSSGILFDVLFKNNTGRIRFIKYAKSGISATTVANFASNGNFEYITQQHKPSITWIRLGVNDLTSIEPLAISIAMDTIASKIKQLGGKGFVFVGENDNNDNNGSGLFYSKYKINNYNYYLDSVSISKGYGFVNLKDVVSNWTDFQNEGFAIDNLHETKGHPFGGYLYKNIFNPAPRNSQILNKLNNSNSSSIDSILNLNGVSASGLRSINFQANNNTYGGIKYDAETSNLRITASENPDFQSKLSFYTDINRPRFLADNTNLIFYGGTSNNISFLKRDSSTAFNYSPSLFLLNSENLSISGTNSSLNLISSDVINPTYIRLRSDRAEIRHYPSTGEVRDVVGLTAGWGGKKTFEIDGTERVRFTASGGVNIDYMTSSSAVNPMTIKGLLAGSATDSLVTSASGVLKRLSITEVTQGNSITQDKVTGITGTTVTFVANLPLGVHVSRIKIWKNGLFQEVGAGNDYTVSSTTPITLTLAVAAISADKFILRIE